jgi:anti-anti-sigma factor
MVRCGGRLVRGEAVRALSNAVASAGDAHLILLDLSEVQMLDAGGLNALVAVHNWASDRGIQVKLVNPSMLVRDTLTRFGLEWVFGISALEDALVVLAARECCQPAASC